MRRLQLLSFLVGVPLVCVGLSTLGCQPGKDPDFDPDLASKGGTKKVLGTKDKGTGGGTKGAAVKATKFGKLTGVVKWVGEVPVKALAQENKDFLDTVSKATDGDHCKRNNAIKQELLIGTRGTVGNVFVWLEPANSKDYFEVPKEVRAKYAKSVVEIDQPGCRFTPHALVMFTEYEGEPTGQVLVVKNGDGKAHNTKMDPGDFNRTVSVGGELTLAKDAIKPTSDAIKVSCSIHPYMRAYIRAFEHPYATVSLTTVDMEELKLDNPRFGTFEIEGIPLGVPVRVVAWHERLGYLLGSSGRERTFQDAETMEIPAKAR